MRIAGLLARYARSVPAARQKLVLQQSALSLAHATGRSMSSGKRVWNVYLSGEIHRCVSESFPTRARSRVCLVARARFVGDIRACLVCADTNGAPVSPRHLHPCQRLARRHQTGDSRVFLFACMQCPLVVCVGVRARGCVLVCVCVCVCVCP